VENDQLFDEEVREYGEKYLKEHNVENEFKTYSSVPHGFGVVGEYEDAKIKTAQAEAFDQMLAWLKTH
jgi:dienelactone hydrolase